MFLADVKERNKSLFYLLDFISIFLICIVQMLELTGRVNIVSRVDTYLISIEGCYISYVGIEVYVSNDRDIITITTKPQKEWLKAVWSSYAFASRKTS